MTIKDRAIAGSLAHNAKRADAVPPYGEHVMQPKLDGWRLVAEVCDGKVNFRTRTGNSYNGKLPAVEQALLERFPAGTWLDGEAVSILYATDGTVTSEWGDAQSALTKGGPNFAAERITYVVFDLIAHRDIDARPLPYAKRRLLLERVFGEDWPAELPVQLVDEYEATDERHEQLIELGYEGSITRSVNAPYASGKRGHGLLKRKAAETEDGVIMGFEAGKDVGTVVFGQFEHGKLVERGRCKRKPKLIPTTGSEWLGRVIEVQHNGEMSSGGLRHPRLVRVREDKLAADCVRA